MKRKRFEKLLMGRCGKHAREARDTVRELIEIRRAIEGHLGVVAFYDVATNTFVTPVFYPYKEMLERIESGKPAIGFTEDNA